MIDLHAPATTLVKRAAIVTMDKSLGDLACGDILIVGGRIQEVAPEISYPSATIIDADGMIATPGFVDSHRHLWEGLIRNGLPDGTLQDYFQVINGKFGPAYTPPDVHAGTLVSALGALNAGVTTILDWVHIQSRGSGSSGTESAFDRRCHGNWCIKPAFDAKGLLLALSAVVGPRLGAATRAAFYGP